MKVPAELPDNTALRAAMARYVAITDMKDDLTLAAVLLGKEAQILVPMCYMYVDGEERPAFANIADHPDMKALHVYTELKEIPHLPPDVCIVPIGLWYLIDRVLWAENYNAVLIDPAAGHGIYIQLYPNRTLALHKTKYLLERDKRARRDA